MANTATKIDWDSPVTKKHIEDAEAVGLTLIGVGRNRANRTYRFNKCGHEREIETDAKGRKLQIEFIEEGIYHKDIWNGGCSSYINSYLANNAVIVPAYGYDRDHLAIETYKSLYPNREIIQVPIHNIATGGGGIHCITQQQPKRE